MAFDPPQAGLGSCVTPQALTVATLGGRLSLQDYSGTAGQQSGMAPQGTRFSTRDADNDNCLCKCAQMLSGGEQRVGHPHSTHGC